MIRKHPVLWGFIAGVVIMAGLSSVWVHWRWTVTSMFASRTPLALSSRELIERLLRDSIPVPDSAYDIQYITWGFTDHESWCAFSVEEEGLKKIEAENASSFTAEKTRLPFQSDMVPQPPERYQPLTWWPKEKGNMKTHKFEMGWIGIDPVNSRVYYNRFTM
jgi:hypothetical protein